MMASASAIALWFAKNNNLEIINLEIQKNMDRQEIEAKVKEFLIDDLEIDEEKIQPEARLKEDIGIDSLDFVDIVVIVEKKFGFKIKTEEMANVKTFNDFCDYIEKKTA
jgi:acyl carrier protein